jgi:hypothetical protein
VAAIASGVVLVYDEPAQRLAVLEKRTTAYRWDLETGPAWDLVDEPGSHAPPELLRDFGVAVDRLGEHRETFDWIFAVAVCRTFIVLEEGLIEFVRREGARTIASKSLDSFVDEETKHVLLFQRYAEAVLDRRDRAMFERVFAPAKERLTQRCGARLWAIPDDVDRHYLFWTDAIFFEEFSIYLEERLAEVSGVQPAWRSIHRLHRIEEIQHLATDEAYLEALRIDDARKRALSQSYVMSVLREFPDTVGISAALAFAKEVGLGDLCPDGMVSKRPFVRHVLERPSFKRTRSAAPFFAELAKLSSGS